MTYIERPVDARAEVLQGESADSITFTPSLKGYPVVPSSAFVTVRGPTANELVARAAVTPTATGDLVVSQAWPLATYPLAEDYCLLWEFTVDGVAYTQRQFFDVCKTKLFCPITTNELLEHYPNLEQHLKAVGEPDADKFVRRAWAKILNRIRGNGRRAALILDSQKLTQPTIELALHLVAKALAKTASTDDKWWRLQELHLKQYEVEWGNLGSLKYDIDEDAIASPSENRRVGAPRWSV
jgi:hypothetical protein